MKIFSTLLMSFLLILVISCKSDTTEKKANNKTVTTQSKSKNNTDGTSKKITNDKAKPKKNANVANKKSNYTDQLAEELKLNQNQKKLIDKARADYFKAKRAIRNTKNKKVENQKVEAKLKADFQRILGPSLYQKQLIFDKKYRQQMRKK